MLRLAARRIAGSGLHRVEPELRAVLSLSALGPGGRAGARFLNRVVQVDKTPSMNSKKFVMAEPVLPHGTMEFTDARSAMKSPLAKELLRIEGVSQVFFGSNFVTVTKIDECYDGPPWNMTQVEVNHVFRKFFKSGKPVFLDAKDLEEDSTMIHEDDSEVVQAIKELLDTRIRPTVQEDGGDIRFVSFDEDTGLVVVKLQGACTSCSSSAVTLKSGVENMLKHYIPEVEEVVEEERTEEDSEVERANTAEMPSAGEGKRGESAQDRARRALEEAGV